MILVEARIKCNPGRRDDFIREAQPVIAATRKEKGNLCYDLFKSIEDENLLLYYERWESRDALNGHIGSEHMKTWSRKRMDIGLISVPAVVKIYDIA